MEEICRCYLDSQCPSDVCHTCFEANPKALWLAWLKCTKAEQHREKAISVTVVTDLLRKELVKVRPLPTGLTQLCHVKMCTQSRKSGCDTLCQNAHSNCELLYWQWQVAIRRLFQKVIQCNHHCIMLFQKLIDMLYCLCSVFHLSPHMSLH